jgi:hypothetical protein
MAKTSCFSFQIKPGFFMNVICVVVINLMINTLGKVIWDLDTFPEWAEGRLS